MREAAFLKLNSQKWKNFESLLHSSHSNPEVLAELYIEINDDLSYAKTYYPESNTTQYLNSLATELHQKIYPNKKENNNRFFSFWMKELPSINGKYQKYFLYSFILFTLSASIGAISAKYDDSYVRLIMGDEYVNMTLNNIENKDPFGVYKSQGELAMFIHITLNNIRVALTTFVVGVLTSFCSGFLIFRNGIMLGAFQYFFYSKNLLISSLLTIWLHGTLEISAIVIAGAAGMVMGNSWLFPGTYSRIESFKRGAKDGMKMVIGLIPVFIMAGFIESFATRHTEWNTFIKLSVILLSASFIIIYFIIYPTLITRKNNAIQN